MKNRKIILAGIAILFLYTSQVYSQPVTATSGTTDYITKWKVGSPTYEIEDSHIYDNGYIGIGTSSPAYLLDVYGGDIDVRDFNGWNSIVGYRIGGNYVLRTDGDQNSIFVGVLAGNTSAGLNNTFVGGKTGFLTTGAGNTFVGSVAGQFNTTGDGNSFFGSVAGWQNTTGQKNTFLGSYSGWDNTIGDENTFCGTGSGFHNTEGIGNASLGYDAAVANTVGDYNSIVGYAAGTQADGTTNNKNAFFGSYTGYYFLSGELNTFLGSSSGVPGPLGTYNLSNASAIGANAIVRANNKMILGNNDVNVGIGLSNDNVSNGPRNKLEINAGQYGANGFDPPSAGNTGYSGLQFRDMTDICAPVPNTGSGVLSVDVDGNVVYVENTGIGHYCLTTITNPLTSTFEIPLNRHDYFFEGQAVGTTDVIVGFSCTYNPIPSAKLQSYQMTTQGGGVSYAGNFNNSSDDVVSIGGIGLSMYAKKRNIGLVGRVREYVGLTNLGVLGETFPNSVLMGGNLNVGVYGIAQLRTHPTSTHNNYAVVGDLGTGCVGCTSGAFTGAGDFAGYFNGDIFTTAGFYTPSDSTLKDNLHEITNPMDVINKLHPQSYTFRQKENESMILPDGTHFGICAQNVATVLPNAVKNILHPARYDSSGVETHSEINFLGVNNTEIIPFLVAGMQEQQKMIESLKAEVTTLKSTHNQPGNGEGDEEEQRQSDAIDVQLSNSKAIVLNQNVPNPFAEQTSISYFITDEVKKAQLFFYDNKGTILRIVDINEKGAGQLNIFAADLSSGNYTYTLIADGKVIETRTMIKQ